MPLYEYQCDACGKRFEVIQKFSDPAVDVCTKCGKGPVVRLLSSPAIQFKGTGWYITDYAQKGKSAGDGKTADGKKDASAETKSESQSGENSTSTASESASKTSDAGTKPSATKSASKE